jgi:hypothetical protein
MAGERMGVAITAALLTMTFSIIIIIIIINKKDDISLLVDVAIP